MVNVLEQLQKEGRMSKKDSADDGDAEELYSVFVKQTWLVGNDVVSTERKSNASARLNKIYKSESSFINSDTYCQVCYSSNHTIRKCCHQKHDTHLSRTTNRTYLARIRVDRSHRRKTLYPAGYYPRSQSSFKLLQRHSLIKTQYGTASDTRQTSARAEPLTFERSDWSFPQFCTSLQLYA